MKRLITTSIYTRWCVCIFSIAQVHNINTFSFHIILMDIKYLNQIKVYPTQRVRNKKLEKQNFNGGIVSVSKPVPTHIIIIIIILPIPLN